MSKKQYFSELKKEFDDNPYKERFLQELQDHTEDLKNEENLKINKEMMEKRFGNPRQIKKDFINITQPWRKWMDGMEAIGYGMLIVAWANILYYNSDIFSNINVPLGILLMVLLFLIPYKWIWFKVDQKKDLLISKKLQTSLIFLPNIILFIISSLSAYNRHVNNIWSQVDSDAFSGILFFSIVAGFLSLYLHRKNFKIINKIQGKLTFLVILLSIILIIIKAYRFSLGAPENLFWINADGAIQLTILSAICLLIWKISKKIVRKSKTKIGIKILEILSCFTLVGYSLIRFFKPSMKFASYDKWVWQDRFILFFKRIENSVLNDFTENLFISNDHIAYFQIAIVLTLLVASLVIIILKKRLSFLTVGLVIYALGLMFVPQKGMCDPQLPTEASWSMPKFNVPVTEVLSLIEKEQYGPFYNMVRHLKKGRQDQAEEYNIKVDDNIFILTKAVPIHNPRTNEQKQKVIGYDFMINSGEEVIQKRSKEKAVIDQKLAWDAKWPESLRCIEKDNHACKALSFKNEIIIKHPSGYFYIHHLALTKNKDFLMVSIRNQKGLMEFYLLDLRSF